MLHQINDLPIPQAIIENVESDAWRNVTKEQLESIVPEPVEWPYLSELDEMAQSTRAIKENDLFERIWGGKPNPAYLPGTIDKDHFVVIGSIDTDRPVCLDYQYNPTEPSVVFLNKENSWQQICKTGAEFVAQVFG